MISIYKKDCTKCEECLVKNTCRENTKDKNLPCVCDMCSHKCDVYIIDEREDKFLCGKNSCLFEFSKEEYERTKSKHAKR